MTRTDLLLAAYRHYDTIYAGLIMLSIWAAATGHLLDWMTERHFKQIIPIYWTLITIIYVGGMVIIGLSS